MERKTIKRNEKKNYKKRNEGGEKKAIKRNDGKEKIEKKSWC